MRRALSLAVVSDFVAIASASAFLALIVRSDGAWAPPRSNSPYELAGHSSPILPPLGGWTDERLKRREGESDFAFASRANAEISGSIFHCGEISTSMMEFDENQWLASWGTKEYGLLLPSISCGRCNQVSYILSRVLRNNGISAKTYGLNGHVVTVFYLGETSYIADPDYGIGPWAIDLTSDTAMERLARKEYEWLTDLGLDGRAHYGAIINAYKRTSDDVAYDQGVLDAISEGQTRTLRGIRSILRIRSRLLDSVWR